MKHYEGMCVGGPKKGERVVALEPIVRLARMERNLFPPPGDEEGLQWRECDRGHYEWDAGHWWWKGWSMKR